MTTNSYYFSEIDLSKTKESKYDNLLSETYEIEGANSLVLAGLSKINFFIGANNSGKSRFLRSVFFEKNPTFKFINYSNTPIIKKIEHFEKNILDIVNEIGLTTWNGRHNVVGKEYADTYLDFLSEYKKNLEKSYFERAIFFDMNPSQIRKKYFGAQIIDPKLRTCLTHGQIANSSYLKESFKTKLNDCIANFLNETEVEFAVDFPTSKNTVGRSIYVPVFRGLKKIESKQEIEQTLVHEYFSPKDETERANLIENNIFNGFRMYEDCTKKLLDSSLSRKKIVEYEKFLSSEFFNNELVQISPNTEDKYIHLQVGNQAELPIYALGDGMQSIIMMTYSAFMSDENCSIYVEEPEIYLHPGMQRTLIEVILRNANLNRHQWYFTTHSNHFLDLTLDYGHISVFNFTKNLSENIKIDKLEKSDQAGLKTLGVLPSSVYRTNCLVWVEGITDRYYIREFLNKYMDNLSDKEPRYKEDIHYTLIELGGGNLVHYNMKRDLSEFKINLKFVAAKSFVVLDGDNDGKGDRIADLQEIAHHLIPAKEIENILPIEVMRTVCSKKISSSKKIKDDMKPEYLDKLKLMSFEDYFNDEAKLGEHLDIFIGIADGYFGTKTGTINDKVKFSDIAKTYMMDFPNEWTLNTPCERLASEIYNFIKSSNE